MDHPVRVAFCPILFGSNGGRFTERGLPIIDDPDEDGESPRGLCDIAFDCGVCSLLAEWVQRYVDQGWAVGWECPHCLKKTKGEDGQRGLVRLLPGYFQEGRDEENPPDIENFNNTNQDKTPLKGCTRCGWQSSFLQLVMRRQRGGP